MDRRDCLSECNDQGVPLEDFKLTFCDRCSQPECTRSLYGKSKFDARVLAWEERLFTGVPRMDKSDSRFLPIAQADFRTIDASRTSVAMSAPQWFDPRDLPKEEEIQPPPPVTSEETSVRVEASPPEPQLKEPEPLAAPPISGVKNLPRHLLLMNAPSQPTMLPGAPSVQQPAPDKWAGPVPQGEPPPAAPVVKKGARIKLGGSGVE